MKKVNWKVYGEALDALQAQFSAAMAASRSTTATLLGRVPR